MADMIRKPSVQLIAVLLTAITMAVAGLSFVFSAKNTAEAAQKQVQDVRDGQRRIENDLQRRIDRLEGTLSTHLDRIERAVLQHLENDK
jgi:peptidoglycan hydrolase CwlO-like protein